MKWSLILIGLLFFNLSYAQKHYELSVRKEGLVLGSSAVLGGVSLYMDSRFQPLSASEILSAVPKVNGFDRVALNFNSIKAEKLSDVLLYSSVLAPFALYFSNELEGERNTYIFMVGETIILNAGLTYFVKSATSRKRPYFYNPEIPLELKQGLKANASFFSGHTSITTSVAFFSARIFSDLYPESKWKPLVWTGAVSLPLLTGTMRVMGGKHYPSDIIVGYGVGAGIGLLIPWIHKVTNFSDNAVDLEISLGQIKMTYAFD